MCGIVGIAGLSNPDIVRDMAKTIVHRGPDDQGFFVDSHMSLGMRRLSIMDPSPLGHQPMTNEDGTIWIVYNGEIYNYQELNTELARRGHVIKSTCDTETVVHAYEEFGDDCVHHLRGMFAFAVWDRCNQRLFAARDRMGIKPLYYAQAGESLVFASELKSIMASGLVAKDLNVAAVWHYLSFGAIPAPLTIWKNVWALRPGHVLTWHSGKVCIREYWDLKSAVSNSDLRGLSEEDAVQQTRCLLEEAVRIRLMSDVPLGAFLSGGIDSGAVVGFMSRFSDRPIQTFSVGYDTAGVDRFDERRLAAVSARRFHTQHREVVVTSQNMLAQLDKIIWHMDQPSHDAVNTYLVSQAAASDVTVAMSGLGGDELFGGYSTFRFVEMLHKLSPLTRALPSRIGRLLANWEPALPMRYRAQWPVRVGFGMAGAFPSVAEQLAAIRFFYPDGEKSNLLLPEFLDLSSGNAPPDGSLQILKTIAGDAHYGDRFNMVSCLELRSCLADVLLRDTDTMSMAHSLEVRVPLLDHKLVEFVMSLPGHFKWKGHNAGKHLLIESVKDLLPSQLLNWPKMGFALPMPIWLREPGLRDVVEDCLSEQSVRNRGMLDVPAVQRVRREFYERSQFGNSGQVWLRMWMLVVLELWCRANLDCTGEA